MTVPVNGVRVKINNFYFFSPPCSHSYHTVERTLCPLNNRDDDTDTARLLIDVSTSLADTVNFTLSTSIVSNFNLQ